MKKQPGYTGHKWTTEELLEFIAMWTRGESVRAIGERFKIADRSVNKKVSRLRGNGVMLPLRKGGHQPDRSNLSWTPEEVEYLIRRRVERATSDQIASELGRTYHAINALVVRLRKEGVEIPMYGCGVRKLWDAETLKAAIVGRGLVPEEKRGRRAMPSPTGTCESCGKRGPIERHHPNYNEPDRFEILCALCHAKADQRDGTRRSRQQKKCKLCGTLFMPIHSTKHNYCGPKCRSEIGRLNALKRWTRGLENPQPRESPKA